ncbi:MAG TPA: EAL domain-containing protein [Cellulomonadaceae bacterium]|nr:EAL domain-containing protein [Cellulomonadaceae bacterium]
MTPHETRLTGGRTDAAARAFGSAATLAREARRQQFATLLEHSPDATIVLGADAVVREWNPAAELLLGRPRSTAVGAYARDLLPPQQHARFDSVWLQLAGAQATPPFEIRWQQPDDGWTTVAVTVAPIRAADSLAGAVVIAHTLSTRDATPRPTGTATGRPGPGALDRDELTALPGRRWLQRRLREPIGEGLARGVAVFDVDAFAMVNETYGPDAADEILAELARRLASAAGLGTVGRWQADAFVWVVDLEDPVAGLEVSRAAVAAALDAPFRVGSDAVRLTVSSGLVTDTLAAGNGLLGAAMDALRTAKDTGRDRAVWYTPSMHSGAASGFRLANDLQHGITHDELRLRFQPIVSLATDEVSGVEALVRWDRPGVGLLSPVSFIDVAERTGQIVLLGRWVAQNACRAAAQLAATACGTHVVSVNVSARQLSDPDLVPMLQRAVQDSGCAPSTIIVEVTETVLMHDLDAASATLDEIKALGIGLDLDDFGTGYSSLLYLKHFPVDRIKIDRSFVAGLGTSIGDTAIVASTIALAHSLGVQAVAEGVETIEQLELLRGMGCDFAQGYLFSRPLDLDALCSWLQAYVPTAASHRTAEVPLVEPVLSPSRHAAADRRDVRADDRDEIADLRDDAGDERDDIADLRDDAGDHRDKIADLRDDVAAERDQVADDRERAGSGPRSPANAAGPTSARREAEDDRTRATADRVVGASDRDQAEKDRDAALADRKTGASDRIRAEKARDDAMTGGDEPPDRELTFP